MSKIACLAEGARVLIVGSDLSMLQKFHTPLIRALVEAGHHIELASPPGPGAVAEQLGRLGARWSAYPLARTGMNPFKDAASLFSLWRLIRRVRPDVTLCYTPKPVIYGGIAAWLARVPARYALITGLGYAFTGRATGRRRVVQLIVRRLYQVSLTLQSGVMFQNPDDRDDLRRSGCLPEGKPTAVFDGCGVDIDVFRPGRRSAGPMTFVMVGRLLADKGLREFAGAARRIAEGGRSARFVIVGGADTNPEAVPVEEVRQWVTAGDLEWTGPLPDVRAVLAGADVFVLPSYREGLPQSTLEAMASGLAVVTTDVPGCRETVVCGVNGLLVPARDTEALASACAALIDDPDRARAMGEESRKLTEARFESRRIARAILGFMRLAGGSVA